VIGIIGYIVSVFTALLSDFKFSTCNDLIDNNQWVSAFFSYVFFCLFYSAVAGVLCIFEPAAAGSGIPEIKAYLNGINLNKIVRIRVLFAKVIGMCFSVAAGLPLGKEGPMIHSGM
jgi:chloride channel 7